MSQNISLDEIKKFWPEKAPDINIVQKYILKYKNEKIVIKYGGNVLIDRNVFNNFISDINVLNKLGLNFIPIIGLAKRLEEVFLPGNSDPQSIHKQSPGLILLRRIRDEAHRFAITFQRKKRNKSTRLDEPNN